MSTLKAPLQGDTIDGWLRRMKEDELGALVVAAGAEIMKRGQYVTVSFEDRLRRVKEMGEVLNKGLKLMALKVARVDQIEPAEYHYTGTLTITNDPDFIDSSDDIINGRVVHSPVLQRGEVQIPLRLHIHPVGQEKQSWPRE
jgi:hypothetical protein